MLNRAGSANQNPSQRVEMLLGANDRGVGNPKSSFHLRVSSWDRR